MKKPFTKEELITILKDVRVVTKNSGRWFGLCASVHDVLWIHAFKSEYGSEKRAKYTKYARLPVQFLNLVGIIAPAAARKKYGKEINARFWWPRTVNGLQIRIAKIDMAIRRVKKWES